MKRVLIFFLVAGLAARAFAQAPKSDVQSWNEVQISTPICERVDLIFYGQLRIGRNISHFVDERIGGMLAFKVGQHLTLSPGYLYIATQPVAGKKGYENRPSFAATLRFSLGKLVITDRNLFERRLRRPADSTRYRNRLQLEHPIGMAKLRAFVSDEVFYDWSAGDWVRNRFAIGVNRGLGGGASLDLYYLRQNDGRSRPGNLHVLGTALKIRL